MGAQGTGLGFFRRSAFDVVCVEATEMIDAGDRMWRRTSDSSGAGAVTSVLGLWRREGEVEERWLARSVMLERSGWEMGAGVLVCEVLTH